MNKLDVIRSKILSRDSLAMQLHCWRFKSMKIVFTNGCFDLLHLGHIDYLTRAADFGDVLIIGLNSDESVKLLNKGPLRPLQDEHSRAMILASLHVVTAVVLFDEETPYELIKQVQPNVLVKGSDYRIEQIAGYDIVLGNGGEVKLIDYLPGYSTSALEKKIRG